MKSELDELEADALSSDVAIEETDTTPDGEEKPAPELDVKELQRELKTLNSRLEESERKSNYWYEQANKKGSQPEKEKVEDKPKPTKKDFGALFTDGDPTALDEYLEERGYVRKDEAASMIDSKAQQYTTLSRYQAEYPDLLDEKSELFQTVREYAQELQRDPDLRNVKPERIAELAIKSALADTGLKPVKAHQDDNRVVRINRQRGHTNTRQPEKSPGQLSDDEKRAARIFGITDKQYLEQKSKMKYFKAG